MRTFVRFRTASGQFAVPVERTAEVRAADGLTRLPGSRDVVVGLLQGVGGPYPVLDCLGGGRDHVLVVETATQRFGILVETVLDLVRVPSAELRPPPRGQAAGFIAATLTAPGDEEEPLVLVVDVDALARWLAL